MQIQTIYNVWGDDLKFQTVAVPLTNYRRSARDLRRPIERLEFYHTWIKYNLSMKNYCHTPGVSIQSSLCFCGEVIIWILEPGSILLLRSRINAVNKKKRWSYCNLEQSVGACNFAITQDRQLSCRYNLSAIYISCCIIKLRFQRLHI